MDRRNAVRQILTFAACLLAAFGSCVLPAQRSTAGEIPDGNPRIKIAYEQPKSSRFKPLYQSLKKQQDLERLRLFLAPFDLPSDLSLTVSDCNDQTGAWYDGEFGRISACYYFLDDIVKLMRKRARFPGVSHDDLVTGALTHVFLHEFGHALINIYQLPVLGRQEDAADALAVYLMLKLDPPEARKLVVGSAFMLSRLAASDPPTTAALSDEHSLTIQRLYNTTCLAFGENPANFRLVSRRGFLPRERAEACSDEYLEIDKAFKKLLVPHLKPDTPFSFGPSAD